MTLKDLTDYQVVQSEMLGRLERAVARNSEAIERLTENQQALQAAMHGLFEHMERFIRGLEGNGRESA